MESIFVLLKELAVFVVTLLVLGGSTERGSQLVKVFFNWLLGVFKAKFKIQDSVSWLLAAFMALAAVYFFGVDATSQFEIIASLPPEAQQLVNAMLVLIASNKVHDNFFKKA